MTPRGPATRSTASQRPPCAEHGLATGPDGRCTLCKRSVAPTARSIATEPGPSVGSRVATALLGIAALASVGVTVLVVFHVIDLGGASPRDKARVAAAPLASDRSAPRAFEPGARGLPPVQAPAPQIHDPAPVAQQPRPESEPLDAVTARFAEQQRRRAEEEAARDRERHESIATSMEARALEQARARVSVTMYSTSWCPSCIAARKYMREQAISFTDFDVEASPSAAAIHRRINPKGSIPTIDVEGEVLVGFSGAHLEHLIDRAAQKHVR